MGGETLRGRFETRRDAEMTVERLVQEHGIERTDVFIVAAGSENTAGERTAGADAAAGEPGTKGRGDAELNGPVEVSVDVNDDAKAATIREILAEFGAAA